MIIYNLESVTILDRDNKHDLKSALYKAVFVSENENNVVYGYVHSFDKISLEACAWSAVQHFIGESTASYEDYQMAYDRIMSPWESFEL